MGIDRQSSVDAVGDRPSAATLLEEGSLSTAAKTTNFAINMLVKYLIKITIAILAAHYLVTVFPQVARSQTTRECDRIYNSDTSAWSIDNRRAYNAKRRACYNKATQQIASNANSYTIRQRNLRRAMVRVQNDYFRRNGSFIEINRNNVSEMMRNIGATPSERRFVIEQMSLYL